MPVLFLVFETAYRVLVDGSITGVPTMPMSGSRSPQPDSSALVTQVSPAAMRLLGLPHRFWQLELSASNAYTVSRWVATKTTLCDAPPIVRFATHNGWA